MLTVLWLTAFYIIADVHAHLQDVDMQLILDVVRNNINQHLKSNFSTSNAGISQSSTASFSTSDSAVNDEEQFLNPFNNIDYDLIRKINFNPEYSGRITYSRLALEEDSTLSGLVDEEDASTKSSPTSDVSADEDLDYPADFPYTDADNENDYEDTFYEEIEYDSYVREQPEFAISLGYLKGIPGYDFPDYTDIPKTSFSCRHHDVPGIYADLETGCQVYHICWDRKKRQSLLCPIGSVYSQKTLLCEFWYNTNCSLTPLYYQGNAMINFTVFFRRMDWLINVTAKNLEFQEPENGQISNSSERPRSNLWFAHGDFPLKEKLFVYDVNILDLINTSYITDDDFETKSWLWRELPFDETKYEQAKKKYNMELEALSGKLKKRSAALYSELSDQSHSERREISELVQQLKSGIFYGRMYEALQNVLGRVTTDVYLKRFHTTVKIMVLFSEYILRANNVPSKFYKPNLLKPKYSFEAELHEFDLEITKMYDNVVKTIIDVLKIMSLDKDSSVKMSEKATGQKTTPLKKGLLLYYTKSIKLKTKY